MSIHFTHADWQTYFRTQTCRNLFYASVFKNNRNAFEEFAAASMVRWYLNQKEK